MSYLIGQSSSADGASNDDGKYHVLLEALGDADCDMTALASSLEFSSCDDFHALVKALVSCSVSIVTLDNFGSRYALYCSCTCNTVV